MNDTTHTGVLDTTVNPDYAPRTPSLPEYPHDSEWVIDMNYLMPFSVMLMILCVLLLILCYLRHRMRQRRNIRQQLRLRSMLRGDSNDHRVEEFGAPMLADRLLMMYPPTYDEATLHNTEAMYKTNCETSEQPPPYTEYHQQNVAHEPSTNTNWHPQQPYDNTNDNSNSGTTAGAPSRNV